MKYTVTYSIEDATIKTSGLKKFAKDDIQIYLFGEITRFLGEKTKGNTLQSIFEYYTLYGENCVSYLDGYFLIILLDKKSNTFYCFNNRYSDTYCNYLFQDNTIYLSDSFAWTMKKLPDSPQLDFEIINLFLNSGYTFLERKIVKDIKQLCPGFYLKVNNSTSQVVKYNGLRFNRQPIADFEQKLQSYENTWVSAIKDFNKAFKTKKLGSALSGGLDTSWVVKTASEAFQKKVNTYTCDYKYELYNESKYARYVADKCNANHSKVPVDETDLDYLPEMISIAEEPVLSTGLSIYKLIKQAKKDGVDTLLVGDGGNNIYHHYFPVTEVHRYVKNLPHPIRNALFHTVKIIGKITKEDKLWQLMYVLHPMKEKNMYPNFYKNLTCYRHFTKEERKKLFKKPYYKEFDCTKAINHIPITKQAFTDPLIEGQFVFGNMQYVSSFHEKFLRHHNMNFYAPYQTQSIMDFICSLPLNILNRGTTFTKLTNTADKMYFQKKALLKYFDDFLIKRNGQPFDQPFHGWFEERPKVIEALFTQLKKRGWYNEKYLAKIFSEHKKQQLHDSIYCELSNHGHRIMGLLSLEVWTKIFIDGIKPKYSNNKPIPLESFLALQK